MGDSSPSRARSSASCTSRAAPNGEPTRADGSPPDRGEAAPDGAGRLRVAIADDHRLVAQAIATMLSFGHEFDVVGIAASSREAVDLCERTTPDVVLMDLRFNEPDDPGGIEATRAVRKVSPHTHVLILSMYLTREATLAAAAAGASGALPKNVDRRELARAIHACCEGEPFLHPWTGWMTGAGGTEGGELSSRLTERELSVLRELVEGKSTRGIATSLAVSEETVKSHLAHIYQKLGVTDRVQAVALALRSGLVP